MSTRNNSSKSNSSKSTKSTRSSSSPQPQQTQSGRQTTQAQTMTQSTAQTSTSSSSNNTRRARKPMTIRVRSTGEEIRRVPVQRSGYAVVRYEGRYHTVRGGGRTAPYIVGSEDSEDVLGRA